MNKKIVWKLVASFAAVLLLFTAILGTVFVSMFRKHTIAINRSSMEKRAVSIAETLALYENGEGAAQQFGMGMGMGHHGMGGYGAYLRFLDQVAMATVWIVDNDRNLISASHDGITSGGELPENAEMIISRVLKGEITYGEEFSGLLNAPTLTVGVPIRTADGISGAVLLHSPVSGVNEAVLQGLFALGAGAVIALVLAGMAAVWLSYRFTNPLRRMNDAAGCLAEGDYTAKTGVNQTDEFGQLAQTIDLLSERLTEARKQQEALDKMKQDFVANVSHELRTPVAVLRGSLEVLRDETINTPEEISEYYDQMLAESRHLERLVNDLLDLSRLQDDQFSLNVDEVNLCHVLWDTQRSIRRSAKEKELQFLVNCPGEECIVNGDYGRLRQLILILLDNAVKFCKQQGTVELTLEKKKDGCLITVTNDGEEIPAETIPHLFDRFYKTNSLQNRSGTGLGLAIAKQIADRHYAQIGVESSNGVTTFFVKF
ncbi:sensor histidine kinase [Lacrimispora defluvii]|uniref:histidine kinase n=1 Tax=Lacrimispora defluvii TaxID=2719233 RepID=A0ABX1VQ85_9FIRM|nr:HAMP domain-containing sensor histidine kinase [Lacrimispora defluvii]NNJ29974.1 HAMP domain-containing histidine kinase [Lacrimispora defluvii]